MFKQITFPSYFSFRTSFFIGLFGLFLVSSTVVFAQEESSSSHNESEETLHKRGDRTEWSQRGERSMQNRRSIQNIQRNRSNDSDLPRLEKYMELETELIAKNLKLSNEQIAMLDTEQAALVEEYTRARLEIEEKVKQKREDVNLRRRAMRKVHQENPDARPSKEVRDAMQEAMKKENEALVKEVMEANRALMSAFQNDRMLILFDVLNEEQYRDYLEQRSSIRKDIQTKRFR